MNSNTAGKPGSRRAIRNGGEGITRRMPELDVFFVFNASRNVKDFGQRERVLFGVGFLIGRAVFTPDRAIVFSNKRRLENRSERRDGASILGIFELDLCKRNFRCLFAVASQTALFHM